MKLAFCLFKYFPFGGLQRDFLRIAKECIHRGHQVDVFAMSWEGEREPGISVNIIPARGLQNHTRARYFVAQLKPHLTKYDLVIGFNKIPGLDIYYAADTCYQAKARSQHSFLYRLTPRYRHLIDYEKAVFAASHTDVLLLSKFQQADFMRFYNTGAFRFHLLPPGIARDRVAPPNASDIRQQTRKEFNIKENDFLLLLVGSGFKTKGLDRILLGYAALPEILKNRTTVYVIGKDNPEIFLRQAKQLGIIERIKFLGGRNDVPRFLLAADLLLHPAYNENTGTVLLEAIAAGLPVLTTDICGYAGYVHTAKAGIVLSSPFQQIEFNQVLSKMLLSVEREGWKRNAIDFAKQADIYSLPERAVDHIEAVAFVKSTTEFPDNFDKTMMLQGEVYRELEGRRTQRVILDNEAYFIKQHFGVGWKEIIKNISQLRLPVVSAENEWHALERLKHLNISVPEIVAYDKKGFNPAQLKSYLITKELPKNISLEDFCKHWNQCAPSFNVKQKLIKEVAAIARIMHTNGINHRDFYICHFLLDVSALLQSEIKLYLIDLHRAQLRVQTPARWIIKDLAGLYFSSKEIGLTKRDILRFIIEYRNKSLRDVLNREPAFWRKVKKRGDKLYRKYEK